MKQIFIRPAVLLSCILFLQLNLAAQDKLPIKFGKVTAQDFDVESPLIDSGTNAVVVADVGVSEFMANTSDLTFSLIFKEKKRIKILNKNGFDAATITIPLYVSTSGGGEERLEELKAYTYNLENGKVTEIKVEKDNIFTENKSKNWKYKKFTFPAIKEGSILEYSYQVKSDFFFNFQPWVFQGEYPVLWSQYEANIPEFFKYVILSQGYQPFYINKNDQSQTSFTFTQRVERSGGTLSDPMVGGGTESFKINGTIDYHTWVMKDVPALKEEPYTTTLRNAIAKIEFQLNQIKYPNSFPKYYLNDWSKVAEDLRTDERFGIPVYRPNNWLDDELALITNGAAGTKEKAKKIYEYVRNNFTCNNNDRMYLTTGLKDVVKNKSGSVADINLLLIAMLRNRDIEAYPVILSTREHGYTHEMYPLIERYNYVVAKVITGNEVYYLDATEPRLCFGKLPLHVYNGHAREITKENAEPVFFTADELKEASVTSVFISNIDKAGVEGLVTKNFGANESFRLRNKIAKTSLADYTKSVKESYGDETEVTGITVDSLKLLDEPVAVKMDIKLKAFENGDDIVYFNPMMGEVIKKNPFAAAKRFYPVEMPYSFDDTYTLFMEVPKGYQVDELPKSVRLNFNEDEGMFEYLVNASGSEIQLRCRLMMKKANFPNEDYESLREFYSFIVKKEAEQIVFKKIK